MRRWAVEHACCGLGELKVKKGRCLRATPSPRRVGYGREMDVAPICAAVQRISADPMERGLPSLGGGAAISLPER